MKYKLVSTILLTLASWAQAGSVDAKITNIQVNAQTGVSDIAVITFETAPNNPPSCAADSRMLLDLSTVGGRSSLSLALTAFSTGRNIVAQGTGECSKINYIETIGYIVIK